MKILLTNDDGYSSIGIQALYDVLCLNHEVLLIAPDGERSAIGHGITLNEPLRIRSVNLNGNGTGYAVSGTPVDCVKLGLYKFYDSPPDIVVSGINSGANTGINLNYSGTVGAAREGALNNILSMAVSIQQGDTMDFYGMAQFVSHLTDKVIKNGLPSGSFLNVNAPDIWIKETKGIKITRQASNNVSKAFEHRTDPKNNAYFWYGKVDSSRSDPDTDIFAISDNYISITPVQCDATDYSAMLELGDLQSCKS